MPMRPSAAANISGVLRKIIVTTSKEFDVTDYPLTGPFHQLSSHQLLQLSRRKQNHYGLGVWHNAMDWNRTVGNVINRWMIITYHLIYSINVSVSL